MTFIMSVVYPAGTKFNMEYYLATHMPLVQKTWAPFGLKAWKVAEYDNADAPYTVQAWLEWESKGHSEAGINSAEGKTVFDDIPNFSSEHPTVLSGAQVGSAAW